MKAIKEIKNEEVAERLPLKMNCSIFTLSLKELIKTFDGAILGLSSNASIQSGQDRNNVPELGAKFLERQKVSFFMGYDDQQHVSLTDVWLKRLWDKFDQYQIIDATTNWIKIKIEDDELATIARDIGLGKWLSPNEKMFVAEFISEPCDGEKDRELLSGDNPISPYYKELTKKLRFRHETLNLITLMPWSHYNSFKNDAQANYLVDWRPTIIDNKIAPPEIVLHIKKQLGHLARVKTYKKVSEDKLELVGCE